MQEYIDLEIDNFRNNLIRVSWLQQCLCSGRHTVLTDHVHRLQTRMILNAGNLALAMVFAVVCIWGMNLSNKHTDSYALFVVVGLVPCFCLHAQNRLGGLPDANACLQVTVVSCFGAILFFAGLMGWCVWYKIVNNPFAICFEGRRITG